ncbi:MAG: hydrogenase-4 component G [Sulfurospirillaceae bacterium]|nr:hydrogenase-4 component G [Sulfurospirillaceae bacterium]
MNIELSFQSSGISTYAQSDKEVNKDKKMSGKEISNAYLMEYQLKISSESQGNFTQQVNTFSLADIGYNGKAIGDLSQDEAKALVADDGFFGISKTSERIADFVINGAGDDVEKLKAGRSGMLQGFSEAESLWGGKLPDISYTTMQKALEKVDARLSELGANVLDSMA